MVSTAQAVGAVFLLVVGIVGAISQEPPMRRRAIVGAISRWQVFVPVMTALGCIAAILKLIGPSQTIPTFFLLLICGIVGLICLALAFNEFRRFYRRGIAIETCANFIREAWFLQGGAPSNGSSLRMIFSAIVHRKRRQCFFQ